MTSDTRVVEPWETDGIKYTATAVLADGTRASVGFSARYDGKDYKVTGSPAFDAIAITRVNANAFTYTVKKEGKVFGTGKVVVSKNGKTWTDTNTAPNAKGQQVHSVVVFEKQ